jgi:hypothetical protein
VVNSFYLILYALVFSFSRIIDGETRIGIFATRCIKKGEHLTYDYQYEPLHNSLVASLHLQTLYKLMKLCILVVQSNKFSRFVQFGADQDCHCGATDCRQKLGVRPAKPKMSSDAALKLVAYQVAVSSPKLKAILSGKDVCIDGCLIMSKLT